MTLRSKLFDDIYFSPEDGLAETRHVFLAGNNLPAAWRDRECFIVAETGFGTGLNFLATWNLFEKSARPSQKLHYISFEQYPLSWDDIFRALAPWRAELGGRIDRLRALYPLRVSGFHRLMISEQVTLTLVFDDVNQALPRLDAPGAIDSWFLDGFAPAKNPAMWTDAVFAEMARLSHAETTFATFTAAGLVKRGLESAGFTVEKRPGFGRKRDMLAGRCALNKKRPDTRSRARRVAILGGGLAGTAAAFVLKRHGLEPCLFETKGTLAAGASGNPAGLFNPRFSARRSAESDFYVAAWAQTVRTLREIQGISDIKFNPCGSVHLATDEEKIKRFRSTAENWGWHEQHMQYMEARDLSRASGLNLSYEGLFLPDAGTVSPAALCRAYAGNIETVTNANPAPPRPDSTGGWLIDGRRFDVLVLACGAATKDFSGLSILPLNTVRGQITQLRPTATSHALKTNLCFGGYLSPAQADGAHYLGATFQRWLDDDVVREEDNVENLARLAAVAPELGPFEIVGARAALRTSSRDHFPVVGAMDDNLYVSAGHGSHGIISTLSGAHVLADMILQEPRSLSWESINRLSPSRFQAPVQKRA